MQTFLFPIKYLLAAFNQVFLLAVTLLINSKRLFKTLLLPSQFIKLSLSN